MNAAIVVPTNRPESVKSFLAAWEPEFKDHRVIVVEDAPERTFQVNSGPTSPWALTHVSWKEIDADLKDDAWIIPRRSGAIRNYGNLLASRIKGLDMIVNLDDDCMPDVEIYGGGSMVLTVGTPGRFLAEHWSVLETPGMATPCHDTMRSLALEKDNVRPRGYPKKVPQIRTMLNHGLWNGVPDIDGETQLRVQPITVSFPRLTTQVQVGALFPMSAMNIAFRPELLPAMYNLPMGQGQPFHRFDDIWCGLIMKKACDAMGWAVRSGSPCIRHIRASDAKRNAELEAPGIVENEKVWAWMAEMMILPPGKLDIEILTEIHERLCHLGTYWQRAADAARIWRRLVLEGVVNAA